MDKYDAVIIGTGPAGLMAQVYAIRYNLRVVSVGGVSGGLMTETHKICNWPGEIAITGADLANKMVAQVKAMSGEIITDQVVGLHRQGDDWEVATATRKMLTARAIIVATGNAHRKLGLADEERLRGRGVTYCATCDAPFYKGRTVAVIGGANSALTSALYLAELCPRVYLIYRSEILKGEPALIDEIKRHPNIVLVGQTNVTKLLGEDRLIGLTLDKPFDNQAQLNIDGVFIEVGIEPQVALFKNLGGELDEFNRIKVKTDQSTSLPGLWAAGDITDGSNGFRQLITACGEGAVAADSVYNFLRAKKAES